ncbi:MAG: nitrogen fixation protein NifQ [Acidiferrobacter sp.]
MLSSEEGSCGGALRPTSAPVSELSQAFAGVLARFHTLGLSEGEFSALWRRHLRARGHADEKPPAARGCDPLRNDEHGELVLLLLAHRSDESQETLWLAHTIATACLGQNHLWQDMGLSDRAALSTLIRRHFARLFKKNIHNMKWKKFFYKELCHQAEVSSCKAPSCSVCADYCACFGPE